jgi:uncharacterized protein YuzE
MRPITFDRVSYDRDADVAYLSVGDPSRAVDFDESAEGHALRYDAVGRLVGLTIVGASALLERDGESRHTPAASRGARRTGSSARHREGS